MSAKPYSFLKGYTFSFKDDGNQIDAWFSAWSGLEKVYVNDQLVVRQRNLATDSTSSFKIGDHEYSTNIHVKSLMKGPVTCTLIKDGEDHRKQRLVFPENERRHGRRSTVLRFFFFIVLGAALGLLNSIWQWPEESVFYACGGLFVVLFVYYYVRAGGARQPVIEEEDCA